MKEMIFLRRAQIGIIAAIVFALSFFNLSALAHRTIPSRDLYSDYTSRIDSINFNKIRSMRNDDDWLYYEIRVFDAANNQVFHEQREGHLVKPNGSAAIKNGDFIAFTHPQGQWENPYVISFRLRESDVAVCTYTVVNQSHESHDPNKQRKKWDKFVSSQLKAVAIGEIIALPIGAGLVYAKISGAYLALLEGIGQAWDLLSPPAKEDVDCDGPVVTGFWKFTGADLLERTNNSRRTESVRNRFNSTVFARKECETVPDTEVFLSIERGLNMAGRFPTAPPPTGTHRPAASAPDGVWSGTWVDKNDVSDSLLIVEVAHPTLGRVGPGGLRIRTCAVLAQPSYNVSVKELAAPVSGSIQFQQTASCVIATQRTTVETGVRDVPAATQSPKSQDAIAVPRRPGGIMVRPNSGMVVERPTSSQTSAATAATAKPATHVMEIGSNVTLELYESHVNGRHNGYRIRYLRKGDGGSIAKDLILVPAGSPIR